MRKFWGAIKRCVRFAGTVWSILGIALLLFLGLELATDLALPRLADWKVGRQLENAIADSEVTSGIRPEPGWPRRYLAEFRDAFDFSSRNYVYWRGAPFSGRYVNVSDDGLRTTIRSSATDEDGKPLEVWMFGGSTLWGVAARDEYTIPSRLEYVVEDQAGVPINVTNFGQLAYVSTQEVIELALQLRDGGRPNLVIFYDGVNDCFSAFENGTAGLPVRHFAWDPIQYHKQDEVTDRIVTVNVQNSAIAAIADRLGRALSPRHQRTPEQSQLLADETIAVYFNNVRFVQRLCETYGAQCLIYWQPTLFTKRNLSDHEAIIDRTFGKSLRDCFDQVYGRVTHSDEAAGWRGFHNLQDLFDARESTVFFDYCHLTEAGNDLVARRIALDVLSWRENRLEPEETTVDP